MHTVILVIHLIICVSLVGLILLQRSEGGGLVGGGGNMGVAAPRSKLDGITRTTYWFAGAFVITSLLLVIMANKGDGGSLTDKLSEMPSAATAPAETAPAEPAPAAPAVPTVPLAE
jgi:preprotein translocase subunit SecG